MAAERAAGFAAGVEAAAKAVDHDGTGKGRAFAEHIRSLAPPAPGAADPLLPGLRYVLAEFAGFISSDFVRALTAEVAQRTGAATRVLEGKGDNG